MSKNLALLVFRGSLYLFESQMVAFLVFSHYNAKFLSALWGAVLFVLWRKLWQHKAFAFA
jgi:hypothetical protein